MAVGVFRRRLNYTPYVDYAAGDTLPSGAVFTRGSAGIQKGASGDLQSSGVSNLRPWYMKIGGVWVQYFMVEPAQTNAMTFSNDFSNAVWTKTATTVASGAGDPGAGTAAFSLLETAVTAEHLLTRTTPLVQTASTAQSKAIWVKLRDATRSHAFFSTTDKAGVISRSWLNLTNGVVGTKAAAHTIEVEEWFGSWYRVVVKWNSGTGGGSGNWAVGPATADNVFSYAGDVTKGIYVFGAQFAIDQLYQTSYIPVPSSSTVTRLADTLVLPTQKAATDMSIFAKYIDMGFASGWAYGTNAGLSVPFVRANAEQNLDINFSAGASIFANNFTPSAVGGSIVETVTSVRPSQHQVSAYSSVNGGALTTVSASSVAAGPSSWFEASMQVTIGLYKHIIVVPRSDMDLSYFRNRVR